MLSGGAAGDAAGGAGGEQLGPEWLRHERARRLAAKPHGQKHELPAVLGHPSMPRPQGLERRPHGGGRSGREATRPSAGSLTGRTGFFGFAIAQRPPRRSSKISIYRAGRTGGEPAVVAWAGPAETDTGQTRQRPCAGPLL